MAVVMGWLAGSFVPLKDHYDSAKQQSSCGVSPRQDVAWCCPLVLAFVVPWRFFGVKFDLIEGCVD